MFFHVLDLVGQHHEPAIDFIQLAAIELEAQLLAAQPQGMTSGVLAQHQLGVGHAHRLRGHDFVGQRVLQHAVLMDAGFVRESIAAGHRLVGLHRHAGDFTQHLARGEQVAR